MNVILWLFVLEIQEKSDMFPQIFKLYSFVVVFIISSLPQSVLMVLVVVFLMCVFWLL